jgi:hypothetical protein
MPRLLASSSCGSPRQRRRSRTRRLVLTVRYWCQQQLAGRFSMRQLCSDTYEPETPRGEGLMGTLRRCWRLPTPFGSVFPAHAPSRDTASGGNCLPPRIAVLPLQQRPHPVLARENKREPPGAVPPVITTVLGASARWRVVLEIRKPTSSFPLEFDIRRIEKQKYRNTRLASAAAPEANSALSLSSTG